MSNFGPNEIDLLFAKAREIAFEFRVELNSGHLLLSFFLLPNKAQELLLERNLSQEILFDCMTMLRYEEPEDSLEQLRQKAYQIAQTCQSYRADSLHLLAAIVRTTTSYAYCILENCHVYIPELRNSVMSFASGRVARKFQQKQDSHLELVKVGVHRSISPNHSKPHMPSVSLLPYNEIPAHYALSYVQNSCNLDNKFDLDPTLYPWLSKLGRNLNKEALEKRLDPLVGRQKELNEMMDVLAKRRANNPCLIGEPGVGKTALVEGLAYAIAKKQMPNLEDKIIIELDVGSLVAGTQLRGSLAEKMKAIKEEVRQAKGKIIVFIDEIHTLVRAGASEENAQDASNDLKSALARGEFPCIGATTIDEYKKYIEQDPALERRFHLISVREPSEEEAIFVVKGVSSRYAAFHQVRYAPGALEASVTLSARVLHERKLPAKAIDVLDLAGARVRRTGKGQVTREDIAEVVAELSSLPVENLMTREKEQLQDLEMALSEKIIGNKENIQRICNVVKRKFAGFRDKRPTGSFLLYGGSGVGKTATAHALSESLFRDPHSMVVFDLSEFRDTSSISRLIGAAPGHVGYSDGGQLTEAVRHQPHRLVVFDNIDRAHPDILALLRPILEEGKLTDSRGRTVFFSNCIVLFTVSFEEEEIESIERGQVGFHGSISETERKKRWQMEIKKRLPTSLLSRMDAALFYPHLNLEETICIAQKIIQTSSLLIEQEQGISFHLTESALHFLVRKAQNNQHYDIREIQSCIQLEIESTIADKILFDNASPGDQFEVSWNEKTNDFCFLCVSRQKKPIAPNSMAWNFEKHINGNYHTSHNAPEDYDDMDLLALPLDKEA